MVLVLGIIIYSIAICMAISYSYSPADFLEELFLYELGEPILYIRFFAYLLFICSIVLRVMMNRCSITVTDKRVYGNASFGKRVDLPMNQISSVALGSSKSIAVATSSGKIQFWLLENSNEIHKAISDILIRQQKTELRTVEATSSGADELKKYKDLLDIGAITQEEFDAKKKQLLGL